MTEPSAIGDELKHKLQQRADQWEASPVTKGYLREVWPLIEAYVKEQTKLARIDTAKRIKTSDPKNLVIFLNEGAIYLKDYIERLEASIKERSRYER